MEAELFIERHHRALTGKIEGANGLISVLARVLDSAQLERRRHASPPPLASHAGEAVHYPPWNRFDVIEIRESYVLISVPGDETSIRQHIFSGEPVHDGLEGNRDERLTFRIVLLYQIEELMQFVQSRIRISLPLFGEGRNCDPAGCHLFSYVGETRKIRG